MSCGRAWLCLASTIPTQTHLTWRIWNLSTRLCNPKADCLHVCCLVADVVGDAQRAKTDNWKDISWLRQLPGALQNGIQSMPLPWNQLKMLHKSFPHFSQAVTNYTFLIFSTCLVLDLFSNQISQNPAFSWSYCVKSRLWNATEC